MTPHSRSILVAAIKRQRVGFAAALTVAVFLIAVYRAPVSGVLLGCGLAVALLLARTCWRISRNGV